MYIYFLSVTSAIANGPQFIYFYSYFYFVFCDGSTWLSESQILNPESAVEPDPMTRMLREAMRMDGHGYAITCPQMDDALYVCMASCVSFVVDYRMYVQVCVYVHADNTS